MGYPIYWRIGEVLKLRLKEINIFNLNIDFFTKFNKNRALRVNQTLCMDLVDPLPLSNNKNKYILTCRHLILMQYNVVFT